MVEYRAEYAREAVALVVGIQRDEFGFPVSADDQPDLRDVDAYYRRGAGNFWLALADGRLVGTLGLLDLGEGRASLRKMFVRPEQRGNGVAGALLERLLDHARRHGLREIYLGTTSRYHAAQRFYAKNGFAAIDEAALPEGFPRFAIEDRFYHRRLTDRD